MAKKETAAPKRARPPKMQGYIAGAGEIVQQDISDTLRQNLYALRHERHHVPRHPGDRRL